MNRTVLIMLLTMAQIAIIAPGAFAKTTKEEQATTRTTVNKHKKDHDAATKKGKKSKTKRAKTAEKPQDGDAKAKTAECEVALVQLMKTSELEQLIHGAREYVANGQLEYINDQELLQRFADVIVTALSVAPYEPSLQNIRDAAKADFSEFPKLLEMLKAKGVKVLSVEEVRAKMLAEVEARQTMAANGRKLFVGIVQDGTERDANGLDFLWPKTAKTVTGDKKDISGRVFKNSTDYFNTLFDMAHKNTGDWHPYVNVDPDCAFAEGKSMWNVAAGVSAEVDDKVPLLISANFDCKNLPKHSYDGTSDADKVIPIGSCPGLGNSGIILVRKDGRVQSIPAGCVTLKMILGSQGIKQMPKAYLAP